MSLVRRRTPLMHVSSIETARHFPDSIDSIQPIVRLTLSAGQTGRRLLAFPSTATPLRNFQLQVPSIKTAKSSHGVELSKSWLVLVGLPYDCTAPMLISTLLSTPLRPESRIHDDYTLILRKQCLQWRIILLSAPHLGRHQISSIPGIEVRLSPYYVLYLFHSCGYSIY